MTLTYNRVQTVIQSLVAAFGVWAILALGGLSHGGQPCHNPISGMLITCPADIKAQRAQVEAEYKAAVLKNTLEARWGHRGYGDPLDFPRLSPEENRLVVKPSAAVPKLPSPEQAKKRLAELHGLLDAIDNFEISKR